MKLRVNIDILNDENEQATIPNCFTEIIAPIDEATFLTDKLALAIEVEKLTNLLRTIFQAKVNNIKIF